MGRRGPQTLEALYERFQGLHGEKRAELAWRLAKFISAQGVLDGYARRIEKTEHTLDVAIQRLAFLREKYAEWLQITAGCATLVAQWHDEEGDGSGLGWIPGRHVSPNVRALLADDDLFPPPVERCEPPHVRRCLSKDCTRGTGEACSVSRETKEKKRNENAWRKEEAEVCSGSRGRCRHRARAEG